MTNNVFNLIIIATHYEGDPTDNSKSFYEFLQGKNTFKVRFGVFGCGNSTYKNFNKMGREV
jgi:sulfite reductase alpha subunit-like flavoprotein